MLIILVALSDIYLTVLQRGTVSLLSGQLNRTVWWLFRRSSPLLPIDRNRFLSYAGPTLVALILIVWVMLLVLGFALIFLPALGAQITSASGNTPTGFWPALYFSAMSLSTLGTGDIIATGDPYRLLMALEALIGFSVLTTSLTYLLSVYSALIRHNSFARSLHNASNGTGNAAELTARFGAGGDINQGQQEVSSLAMALISLIESHHIYVVLRYFRMGSTPYALPRFAFLTIDSASLMRTAIDQEKYRSLVRSISVAQWWNGGMQLLTGVGGTFLPDELVEQHSPDHHDEQEWRGHYRRVINRLGDEGIAIAEDLEAGEDHYVVLRREWQAHISALTDYLQYEWNEICPDEHRG